MISAKRLRKFRCLCAAAYPKPPVNFKNQTFTTFSYTAKSRVRDPRINTPVENRNSTKRHQRMHDCNFYDGNCLSNIDNLSKSISDGKKSLRAVASGKPLVKLKTDILLEDHNILTRHHSALSCLYDGHDGTSTCQANQPELVDGLSLSFEGGGCPVGQAFRGEHDPTVGVGAFAESG